MTLHSPWSHCEDLCVFCAQVILTSLLCAFAVIILKYIYICLPGCDPGLLISWVEDPTGSEGVGRAGVGHAFTWVVCSLRSQKRTQITITKGILWYKHVTNVSLYVFDVSSPSASVLLRCGDGDGEDGEGGARLDGGCPGLGSTALEVKGTAGEAEAEEVGRFWKYCSPGSSSSKPPHG